MPVDVQVREDAALVVLGGEAGLAEAVLVKSALTSEALAKPELHLDIGELTGIDTAMLQMVHALRCSGRRRGFRVLRVSPVQASVSQAAADAGAAGLGCGRVCGETTCIFEDF